MERMMCGKKGIVFNIDIAFAVGIVALGLLFVFRSLPDVGGEWPSAGLARLGNDYAGAMIELGMFENPNQLAISQWLGQNLAPNINMSIILNYYILSGNTWSLSSTMNIGDAPGEWFGGKKIFYKNSTVFGVVEYRVWPR